MDPGFVGYFAETFGFVHLVVFVAFVENNATMSSIWYFENHVCGLCKTEGSKAYSDHFSMINKCFDNTQKSI